MTFWNSIWSFFSSANIDCSMEPGVPADYGAINPATGLPMVGGLTGFDVGGSPFGMDWHALGNSLSSSTDLFNTTWTDACIGGDSFGSSKSFSDF